MKQIIVRDSEDTPYTLTFTVKTIMELEQKGFDVNKYDAEPVTMTVMLFEGALKAEHPNITTNKAVEILELIEDKEGLMQALTELYSEPIKKLMADKGKKKWEANF